MSTYLTPEHVIGSILELRKKEVRLRPLKYLNSTIKNYEGDDVEFSLRPYQVQGALSLYVAPRMVLGDSCGLGKTVQTIAALCCTWESEPNKKAIVVTCKSSVNQWKSEIELFTRNVSTFTVSDSKSIKQKQLKLFSAKDRTTFDTEFGYSRNSPTDDLWEDPNGYYSLMCYLWKTQKNKDVRQDLHGMIKSYIYSRTLRSEDIQALQVYESTLKGKHKKYFTDKKAILAKRYGLDLYKYDWSKQINLKLMQLAELDSSISDLCRTAILTPSQVSESDISRLKSLMKIHRLLDIGTQDVRTDEYKEFASYEGPAVLILTYAKVTKDVDILINLLSSGFIFIADECTAFKSTKTDVHLACERLSKAAEKSIGLTATLIKNNLLEGFGIYKVLVPDLFEDYDSFLVNYCKMFNQKVGNTYVLKVVGHSDTHISKFVEKITPYYLGRLKYEVAKDLPDIIRKDVFVDMTDDQEIIYNEALSGMLVMGEGVSAETKKVTKLTELIYCQEIVDHPNLISRKGSSGKLETLDDMLSHGEFSNQKVVVYTRFSSMLDVFDATFSKKLKYTKIHGTMNSKERDHAKIQFQNDPDTKVIFITDAAAHAVNLQSASAVIYYDLPFSGGNYIQILGRADRIGSQHDNIYCVHLVTRNTIDEMVLRIVVNKLQTIEKTIGKQIKTDDTDMDDANQNILKIYDEMLRSARNKGLQK